MLERNFVRTIEESLKDNWELQCFSDFEGEPFTYGDVAESILIFHEVFSRCGFRKGDKVAVCGKNSVNWAKMYLATVTYGGIIVPILPDFAPEDITNIINHSETTIFFADEAVWKQLDPADMAGLEVSGRLEDFAVIRTSGYVTDGVIAEAKAAVSKRYEGGLKPEELNFDEIGGGEVESIVYTSGTTGFSKGVMLSHNCLMANVDFAQNNIEIRRGDTIVSFLPTAHSFGCAFEFLFPFATGCHITFFNRRITPKVLIRAFQEVRPRLILSVPMLIEKIYFKQLKPILNKGIAKVPVFRGLLRGIILKKLNSTFGGNFICIIIGAAAFNPEVEAFLTEIGFRFTAGYGMTECGPLISYMPWDEYRSRSAGRIINYLEARIDSEDSAAVQGEICVRGENVMLGYYKNGEATREAIDEEGWLHTGDMGTLDPDGVVYIKGRCKNLLLGPSGQNIYPEELEAKLCNHDIVADALVLARDKGITALLYPDRDAAAAEGLNPSAIGERLREIVKLVNRDLPGYSKIASTEIREEEFEKTPTSKIKRYLYA